ncbi:MAG TPA: Uma2 family endonuclease [Polyangiaceae bacterium]
MSAIPSRRMTPQEYLAWEREQPQRHQYLHGEAFAMAGGSPRHNALCLRVGGKLDAAFGDGPCHAFSSDQRVAVHEGEHYVYPDVTVVCGPREYAKGTKDTLTNPSVVIEVLSKNTEAYDRGEKWDGYRQVPSLADYLLVSQSAPRIEHFQRASGGEWRYRVAAAGGRIALANGMVIEVDAVYRGIFDLEGE